MLHSACGFEDVSTEQEDHSVTIKQKDLHFQAKSFVEAVVVCRLQSQILLSLSLLSFNAAIPKEGKAIVTAAALKDLLLLAAILLKTSAAACETLIRRLRAPAAANLLPQTRALKATSDRKVGKTTRSMLSGSCAVNTVTIAS